MKLFPVHNNYVANFPRRGENLDIDALKLFTAFLADCIVILELLFMQKNITAAINFVTFIIGNFAIFSRGGEALQEIEDLQESERKELSTLFAQKLDIKNDKLENVFERAFDFVLRGYSLISIGLNDIGRAFNFVKENAQADMIKTLIPKVTVSYSPALISTKAATVDDVDALEVGFTWENSPQAAEITYNTYNTSTLIVNFAKDFVAFIVELRKDRKSKKAKA